MIGGRRALDLADSALDRAEAHLVLGEIYQVAVATDDALAHLTAAIAAYREVGATPPARLYASIADVSWRPGRLQASPDRAEVDRLLAEGLTVARTQGDALAEAGVLAGLAIRTESADARDALFDQVRSIIDRSDDQVPFVHLLSLQANNEVTAGNALKAREILDHAWALASRDPRARTDILFFMSGNTAFALGELGELEASTTRYEQAVAAAGPHVRMHAQRGRALIALCRADWAAAREVGRHVARTIDAHPETVFCGAAGTALAYGASAAALLGDGVEARELLARARRIAEQPSTHPGFLPIALATQGLRGDLLRLDDRTPVEAWVTDLAPALAAIGEWERILRRLPELERRAARSDRFSGALVEALHEELAARDGGPEPQHAELSAIGYVGFSELLRFRSQREA